MKFNFHKKNISAFLLALAVLLFSSCQEVVFDNIRKEVQLEEGKIAGDIRSIVRYGDYFYIANGGIYFKNKDWHFYGVWFPSQTPTTSKTDHVLKLAADQNYLYALVGISVENEKEGENIGIAKSLYYSTDGSNWTLIKALGTDGVIPYEKKYPLYTYLICTNTINPANRKAYIIFNSTQFPELNSAYELNGENVKELELADLTTELNPIGGDKPFSNAFIISRSCVWYNGKVLFFNSNAATTNETAASPATMYYYGNGSFICWGGASVNTVGIACKSVPVSMGVTSDFLLVGTDSGIVHHLFTNGIPGDSFPFVTNAAATLSSAYIINSLLVAYPELSETQTPIYASQVYMGNGSADSAQFDHVGLWAYYPERGNWNRE